MSANGAKAIFLDRDGTLIHDVGYPRDPDAVRLLPGVGPVLAALRRQGFLLIVVSNQSGIGRGLIAPEEAEAVHRRVLACLAAEGVHLDAAYYCPHLPDAGCSCRKPSPGLLLQAAREWAIDLARSFLVGDKPCDIEAGRRAGCRTIWLTAGRAPVEGAVVPDAYAADWPAVVRSLL